MLNVKIDTREHKRVKEAEDFYKSKGYDVEILQLETGDYVFDDKVVFEYKTYADMFSSIMDNRVFDESLRQSEKYPFHYVIIVGSDKDKKNALYRLYKLRVKFTMKQYYGALARLNTYTNVIFAPNTKKAFKIMECQTKKCLDGKPLIRELTKKTSNPALNILMMLPDVKYNRAKSICDVLGLESVEDLMNVEKEDLLKVNRIGGKIADNILNGLHSKYGF